MPVVKSPVIIFKPLVEEKSGKYTALKNFLIFAFRIYLFDWSHKCIQSTENVAVRHIIIDN